MKYLLTYTLFFIAICTFSQKNADPTDDDIAKAKALKLVYPDNDVVLIKSSDHITFNLSKHNNKIAVNHLVNEELINISARADIQQYIFYDGESKVNTFNFKYRNKKTAYFQINDESYTSDDLFHNDVRVKHAHIDFPVLGYKYFFESEKHYKDIKYFTSLYFTNDYPTLNKEIKLIVPSWLTLELKEMNFEGYDIIKSEKVDEKQQTTIITYKVTNLPARWDEKRSPGPSHIYPHILVLAKSFTKDGETKALFNETKDLYQWYKSLVDDMNDDTTSLKAKVEELTANAATDDEKIKNIFYWVQDNIRYIAFEDGIAGFKPDESQNVYKKRYGDCKGMANLTKQMLQLAGFDARLTWIGTKRIAYDYSTPSLSVDNHMICTLFKDGKQIFLDGTEKFSAYGEYAERIQGKQALIEDGDAFILAKVPSASFDTNQETYTFNATISNDALEGTASRSYTGESRASFLYYYNTLKNDKKKEALTYYLNNDDSNVLVTNVTTSDLENREGKLAISYDLKHENTVSSFDDEIYVDLDYSKEFNRFEFNDRQTDYLFAHKRHFTSIINLKIPDGYRINETPQPITVDTKNYTLQVSFEMKEQSLHYQKTFILKNAIIETSDFKEWNEAIKALQNIYQEQIILTKKAS